MIAAKRYWKHRYLFLMLVPVLAYYLVFHYLPMYGVVIAFKDYYVLKGILGSPWVGAAHFRDLFDGAFFLRALRNTVVISALKLAFGFPAPILLALLINEVRDGLFKRTVQTISYLPHFLSWVVLAGIVIETLSPSRGPVNWLIRSLGGESVYFLGEERWFRTVIVVSGIWRQIGWQSIIFLAAMAGINPELYEAATIDGAGRLRKIIRITIPSIMNVIVIMLIFAVGSIINDDFEQIYNLLNANVLAVGDVLSTYTYNEGLVRMNFSFATAVGLFRNVISFSLVIIANQFAKRASEYALW